jgi:hypothetical protein
MESLRSNLFNSKFSAIPINFLIKIDNFCTYRIFFFITFLFNQSFITNKFTFVFYVRNDFWICTSFTFVAKLSLLVGCILTTNWHIFFSANMRSFILIAFYFLEIIYLLRLFRYILVYANRSCLIYSIQLGCLYRLSIYFTELSRKDIWSILPLSKKNHRLLPLWKCRISLLNEAL